MICENSSISCEKVLLTPRSGSAKGPSARKGSTADRREMIPRQGRPESRGRPPPAACSTVASRTEPAEGPADGTEISRTIASISRANSAQLQRLPCARLIEHVTHIVKGVPERIEPCGIGGANSDSLATLRSSATWSGHGLD